MPATGADIPIASELTLMRTQFEQELAQTELTVRSWAQRISATSIEIPVKMRDDITAQVNTLRQQLSQPIIVPVQFGGGAGGGMFNPAMGAQWLGGGTAPDAGGGGDVGGGGGGGWSGLFYAHMAGRLIHAGLAGIRGFESISDSNAAWSDAERIDRNAATGDHAAHIEAARERLRAIREREGAFSGMGGMTDRFMAWSMRQSEEGSGWQNGLGVFMRLRGFQSSAFDPAVQAGLQEARIKSEEHTEKQERQAEQEDRQRRQLERQQGAAARGIFDYGQRLGSHADEVEEASAGGTSRLARRVATINQHLRDELAHINEHAKILEDLNDGTEKGRTSARNAAAGLRRYASQQAQRLAADETAEAQSVEARRQGAETFQASRAIRDTEGRAEEMQLRAEGRPQEAARRQLQRSISDRYDQLSAAAAQETDPFRRSLIWRERDAVAQNEAAMMNSLTTSQAREERLQAETVGIGALTTDLQSQGRGRESFYAGLGLEYQSDMERARESPATQRALTDRVNARARLYERQRARTISNTEGEARELRERARGEGGIADVESLQRHTRQLLDDAADDPEAQRAIIDRARSQLANLHTIDTPRNQRELYFNMLGAGTGRRTRDAEHGVEQNLREWERRAMNAGNSDADRAGDATSREQRRQQEADNARKMSDSTDKYKDATDVFAEAVGAFNDHVVG